MLEQFAARFGVGFFLPEAAEVFEYRSRVIEVGRGAGSERVQFGVEGVALGDVLGAVQVAQLVEIAQSLATLGELPTLAADVLGVGVLAVGQAIEDLLAHRLAGLELGQEARDLLLDRACGRERLVAAVLLASRRAVVASLTLAAARRPVHSPIAALAAHDAAQEVVRGGPAGVLGGGALAAQVCAAVEQILGDQRLMLAADLLARAALCRYVAAIGEVAEHVAHGVGAEQVAARRALAAFVEPLGDVAMRVAARCVDLEHREHQRRALGIGNRDPGLALEIAPRQAAGQEALPRLLLEAHRRPERK